MVRGFKNHVIRLSNKTMSKFSQNLLFLFGDDYEGVASQKLLDLKIIYQNQIFAFNQYRA
jgi:hypothetical protein